MDDKIILVAISIIILGGIYWTLFLAGPGQQGSVSDSLPEPAVNETSIALADSVIPFVTEVSPTGKKIPVKVNLRRGFFSVEQGTLRVRPGDDIVWTNEGSDPVTLVSPTGLFEERLLDNDKRTNYTFSIPGTYSFYLKENESLKATIIVEP